MSTQEFTLHFCEKCLSTEPIKGKVDGVCSKCRMEGEVIPFHVHAPINQDRYVKITFENPPYEIETSPDGNLRAVQRFTVPKIELPNIMRRLEEDGWEKVSTTENTELP